MQAIYWSYLLAIGLLLPRPTSPALTGIVKKYQFDHLIAIADQLHAETGNDAAATAVLRGALLVCPSCKAPDSTGKFSGRTFVFDDFPDRVYMSKAILPALSQYKPKHVLWVGIQAYTLRALYQLIDEGIEVTSIEPDATQAGYGSPFQHITARLQNLHSHVPPGSFDAIIINGVIGWGIDGEQAVSQAVRVMHKALKNGGVLVVGWNRGMGTCCEFDPWFRSQKLASLPAVVEVPESQTHHVYEFFRKNDALHGSESMHQRTQ